MAPLCCAWLVEGSIAAQAELKCWWMPHPLAGLKRALLGWQHPGGEFSNTKTERKRQKTKKEQFLILKRKIIYGTCNHTSWLKTKASPNQQHCELQTDLQKFTAGSSE